MRVPGGEAEPVLDHDEVAVAAGVPAGEDHHAPAGRLHARAAGHGEVDAGVPAAADVAEAVAHWTPERPEEAHGRVGMDASAPAQGADRLGAGDSVGPQTRRALVGVHRPSGTGAEAPVDAARGEAAAPEEKLQGGHVPADVLLGEHAAAEQRATAASEGAARPRPGHAVDGQALAPLEAHRRRARHRAGHPVHLDRVEPLRLQGSLERGNAGAPRDRGSRGKAQGGDEEDGDAPAGPSARHGSGVGRAMASAKDLHQSMQAEGVPAPPPPD